VQIVNNQGNQQNHAIHQINSDRAIVPPEIQLSQTIAASHATKTRHKLLIVQKSGEKTHLGCKNTL